ncbi:MAG TPA: thrombospondin type 3 repeat-containing protein [Verrucomicrobiota bacterium]|nr:thrombospondin type 3 repeat-containing protein [Verrucomicrobiota bacterium]HNT16158.1 thrombospondin type 3 repeat-containing protein [Verrucomicrobiota bacterium]
MKTTRLIHLTGLALALAFGLQPSASLQAATTINPSNKSAYAANLGWVNAYADGANGAVIGEYVCSGYLYAANVGWIHLGDGTPANGIQYQNNSGADYGINLDGLGNLRGYAYGANIGWINFENTGAPRVNLATGKFSGHVWSANCGWISLSNAVAHVQTDTIAPGADTDGDGITDAWELTHTNSLTAFTATSDSDGDGQSDLAEYLADTNPRDANDNLRITHYSRGNPTPDYNVLQWTSRPTRWYGIEYRAAFDLANPWTSLLNLASPGANIASFYLGDDQNFFRIRAFRPLSP